jgi:hypothetical protein
MPWDRLIGVTGKQEQPMIGAIQNNHAYLQAPVRAGVEAPAASASTSAPGGTSELAQQVTELIETHGETAEAMLQAQVSIFKEALDIRQSTASGILQMLSGIRAFQAREQPGAAAGSTIDVVA